MALLKFFEGKEGSYSPSSHSGGLYFAKDTGIILFKGVRYGGQPDLSDYATKSDISNLQGQVNNKASIGHTHKVSEITDLVIADSSHNGLMSSGDKSKLENAYGWVSDNQGKLKFASVDILKGFNGSSLWDDTQSSVCISTGNKPIVLKLTNLDGEEKQIAFNPTTGIGLDIYGQSDSMVPLASVVGDPSMCKVGSNEFEPHVLLKLTLPNATSSKDGLMSKNDKSNLDEVATDKAKIVKHVFFNMASSVTSPGTTLDHDITVGDNKFGLFFNGPMAAQYTTYPDPIKSGSSVQTIKVSMPPATASTNGFMTKTQASQLSSLYTAHNGKTYLPLSGGTVTGYTAFNNGLESGNGITVRNQGLELYSSTYPFIDFHYGNSSADYTSRIIESSSGVLKINEVSLSSGQVTATKVTQTSDERLKENINPITDDLDKMSNISFKEFNYKSDKNKIKSYGVIAQDLEEVGLKNLVVEDANGYKSVDYTALLILEIQRLRNEIDILKSKLS